MWPCILFAVTYRENKQVFVKSYEKVNSWHRSERDSRMSETIKISKSKERKRVSMYLCLRKHRMIRQLPIRKSQRVKCMSCLKMDEKSKCYLHSWSDTCVQKLLNHGNRVVIVFKNFCKIESQKQNRLKDVFNKVEMNVTKLS